MPDCCSVGTPARAFFALLLLTVLSLEPGRRARLENDALLLIGVGSRANNCRLGLAAIDSHMGDARRDILVVPGAGDLVLAQVFAEPQVDLATDHVERGLLVCVEVRFRSPSRRHTDHPEPERLRSDRLGAYATRVAGTLLALVRLDRAYHTDTRWLRVGWNRAMLSSSSRAG